MKKKRAIIWTPEITSLNGQNIVTNEVTKILEEFFEISKYEYFPGLNIFTFKYLINLIFLIKNILKNEYEFIYLVCSRSLFGFIRDLPILFLSKTNRRIIVHVHGSDFPDLFRNKFLKGISSESYKNCEIILPSMHLKNDLKNIKFKKIYICENFIGREIQEFSVSDNVIEKRNNHKFKILWNSNILSSKGFFETYEAIKILYEQNNKIEFIVLGKLIKDSENTLKELKFKYLKLKKTPWFTEINQVDRDEYKKIILKSNLIILPSTYKSECQPLSIIEAMIFQKHVIINNTIALKTTVGNYPAEITKRNKKSIARSITKCMENDLSSVQKRKIGAIEAKRRFSYENFYNTLLEIFNVH